MKRHQLLTCAALVLSIVALAFTISTPTHTAAASPGFAPVTAVPLYRFYRRDPNFHLYTADPNERALLHAKSEWAEEQQEGFVFPRQVPGTVKLLRLVKQEFGSTNHFCTIDPAEADHAGKAWGWKPDGFVGWVSPKPIAGTVPLYRLWLPYVAPEGAQEASWLEKITGAGAPFTISGTGSGDDHFYTIDKQQETDAINQGYQYVRKEAYIWPQPVTLDPDPKPAPPAPLPESYYTEQLFNRGCTKGYYNNIACSSKQGYFDCEYYLKQGNIKVTACTAKFDLASFGKIEANLVDLGCKRFLGRAGEYICESWAGGEACDAAIKTSNGLITKCFTPRTNLVSSYKNSFGREPTAQEVDYWAGQIKANKLTYKDLMQAQSQWLKTAAATLERRGVVNRSVYEAFGRHPTADEVNNINGLIASNGTNYADLVKGHVGWMTGGSPQQDQALRAMIGSAFSNAKKPQPNEAQYKDWMAKVKAQKLTFSQVVALLK